MENTPDRTSTPVRLSLRDYQRELAERLRQADSTRSASKLGVQVGTETWLVDLIEAGEVIPVPPITTVPLTRSWFRGVGSVETTERARLVLLGERLRSAAALLVDRSLGLRNPAQLRVRPPAGEQPGWVRAEYDDEAGGRWRELDVRNLVQHEQFLNPGQ